MADTSNGLNSRQDMIEGLVVPKNAIVFNDDSTSMLHMDEAGALAMAGTKNIIKLGRCASSGDFFTNTRPEVKYRYFSFTDKKVLTSENIKKFIPETVEEVEDTVYFVDILTHVQEWIQCAFDFEGISILRSDRYVAIILNTKEFLHNKENYEIIQAMIDVKTPLTCRNIAVYAAYIYMQQNFVTECEPVEIFNIKNLKRAIKDGYRKLLERSCTPAVTEETTVSADDQQAEC